MDPYYAGCVDHKTKFVLPPFINFKRISWSESFDDVEEMTIVRVVITWIVSDVTILVNKANNGCFYSKDSFAPAIGMDQMLEQLAAKHYLRRLDPNIRKII